MNNKEIISSVVGASFFAIGYIGLSVAVLPSILIGAGAYVASELVLNDKKKEKIIENKELSFSKKIENAKKSNRHINEMISEIDDYEVRDYLKNINKTTSKIITAIQKENINKKSVDKFLDYYLPVCVNIIDRYDEIENQDLTSKDSKEYMKNSKKIVKETSLAFEKILNSMYQRDIVNNEAEMKVYNQMLKADGYDSSELELKVGDDDE